MSVVNAKEIMVEAARGKYAIGAFNITDLVQLEGVVDAAIAKKSPLIIQTSVKPSKFLGTDVLVAIFRTIAHSPDSDLFARITALMLTIAKN
jgi:fructose/tagatose bisphosphate aldolase